MNVAMFDMILGMIGIKGEDKAKVAEFVVKVPELAKNIQDKINNIGVRFDTIEAGVLTANQKLDILVSGPGEQATAQQAVALIQGEMEHDNRSSPGGGPGILGGDSPLGGSTEPD